MFLLLSFQMNKEEEKNENKINKIPAPGISCLGLSFQLSLLPAPRTSTTTAGGSVEHCL